MRSSSRTPTAHPPSWSCLLKSPAASAAQVALSVVIVLLAAHLPAGITVVEAAANNDQLVFSMGLLTAVDTKSVTLTFNDGQSETFTVAPQTTIQTQNGDAQTVSDLDVGNMVVVIAREDNPTALTIVNGGDAGFHEAGPADMRGHENDACAPCNSESHP